MSAVEFQLENFTGPMELLLHLLDKEQLAITEVSLSGLTEQYLDWLHQAPEMDMETSSAFIVTAAELIRLKLKALLPKEQEDVVEEKSPLVDRLQLYRFHREHSDFLAQTFDRSVGYVPHPVDTHALAKVYRVQVPLTKLPLHALEEAYRNVHAAYMDRQEVYEAGDAERPLEAVLSEMTALLQQGEQALGKLFGKKTTRSIVLDVFFALLEGMRMGYFEAAQKRLFAPIRVQLRNEHVI